MFSFPLECDPRHPLFICLVSPPLPPPLFSGSNKTLNQYPVEAAQARLSPSLLLQHGSRWDDHSSPGPGPAQRGTVSKQRPSAGVTSTGSSGTKCSGDDDSVMAAVINKGHVITQLSSGARLAALRAWAAAPSGSILTGWCQSQKGID